jgi:tRNA threonylcarbamoyladenosine biosynthesis protein TsaB
VGRADGGRPAGGGRRGRDRSPRPGRAAIGSAPRDGLQLALETATAACSVAVADAAGRLLTEITSEAGPAHAQRLLPDAHYALSMCGATLDEVAAVLVSLGPGSFTGLRIGIATARALAQAEPRLRLVGVPTLAALAQALADGDPGTSAGTLVPLIDGRRSEVFAARFERRGEALVEAEPRLAVVRAADLAAFVAPWPGALLGGDGARLYADLLPATVGHARAVAAPTAGLLVRALQAGVPGLVEGIGHVLPLYGRRPDAVRWAPAPAARGVRS